MCLRIATRFYNVAALSIYLRVRIFRRAHQVSVKYGKYFGRGVSENWQICRIRLNFDGWSRCCTQFFRSYTTMFHSVAM